MDPMVSARVPAELRDQVNEKLRAIGSNPTELINKAYEFFLDTKTLPGGESSIKEGRRTLSRQQLKKLKESIACTTEEVPESYFDGMDYNDLLAERLRESYEALT